MNDLINNTLNIISKISRSKCGYLLQVSQARVNILTIWGESVEPFQSLNSYLHEKYISGGITRETVEQSITFKKLKDELMFNSFFIEEVQSFKERNESIYILLFSENHSQFSEEYKDRITSVLTILSSQVKKWFEDKNRSGQTNEPVFLAQSMIDDNGLLSDWESIFKNLLDASPDFIFILNNSGNFILVNQSATNVLDYSLQELKGKHFTDIIETENNPRIFAAIDQTLKTNITTRFEVNLISKYERLIPFEINCRAIMKEDTILGLLGTGKNITSFKNIVDEIKRLKPQVIEANRIIQVERSRTRHQKSLIDELNRVKSEFVSNISHEFRTPLASIIGFSETINSDPDLPPEMKKEFNNVILNEGKRLAKLINDVLDMSKIEGGKITLINSTFDAHKMIANVIENQKEFADRKNITINFEHSPDQAIIEADREKLFQAFDSLINNSVKFTNEYGRIKIICNHLFRELEFIITDTGIGIPEKDLPYIFQKFYRVSRPGTELPGTGVGLVFVKQVVDLHKGLITAQSELGSGTTFVLKLPKSSKIEKTEE